MLSKIILVLSVSVTKIFNSEQLFTFLGEITFREEFHRKRHQNEFFYFVTDLVHVPKKILRFFKYFHVPSFNLNAKILQSCYVKMTFKKPSCKRFIHYYYIPM